jgi:glycosyltransferase involved in cell wall biosynthesis
MPANIQNHTLLIHQAFASKDDPGGTRHYELGRKLVAEGQKFTVVTSDVSYLTSTRTVPHKKLMSESYEDGIRILRVRTYSPLHLSYLHRVASFLCFTATSVIAGVWAGRPDIVMGTTPPIFQAISAWVLSVLHRRPFLLEVRDLWPEFAIDIGLLKNPVLIRVARWLEDFLYRRADHLLVNSPAYREYLIAKGVDENKVSFISNGVDPGMFDPLNRGEGFRARYKLRDKFVATYAGALGMANDIDMLLQAADTLRNRDDIHILIVGAGKEHPRLEEQMKSRGLTNVTFAGSFPKNQMPEVLAASDACIAILRNIRMFATTYPNKVFDYMAAGRPTILAIDGVIRKVIEAAQAGIFVPPGNAAALAQAIAQLADSREEATEMGANARAHVVKHFNREDQARELSCLLMSVATRRTAGRVGQ